MNRRPKQGYITPGDGVVSVEEKNLAEYNMQFMEDMRRFLRAMRECCRPLSSGTAETGGVCCDQLHGEHQWIYADGRCLL